MAEPMQTRAARLVWEQVTLPRLVTRLGVDVVHSPHYTMPLATATFFNSTEVAPVMMASLMAGPISITS